MPYLYDELQRVERVLELTYLNYLLRYEQVAGQLHYLHWQCHLETWV